MDRFGTNVIELEDLVRQRRRTTGMRTRTKKRRRAVGIRTTWSTTSSTCMRMNLPRRSTRCGIWDGDCDGDGDGGDGGDGDGDGD